MGAVGTPAARRRWSSRTELARLAGLGVLCLVGLLGFRTAFGTDRSVIVGTIGLLLGLGIAVVGSRYRLSAPILLLMGLTGFLLVGGAVAVPETTLAGVVPTLETLRALASGAVRGWRELLTVLPPTGGEGSLLVVPYFTGLVAGLLGGSVGLRSRRPRWALLVPVAVLVAGILVGTDQPAALIVQGAVFAGIAVLWLWACGDPPPERARRTATAASVRRRVGGVAVLAVAAGSAWLVLPYVPLAHSQDRFVLRDVIEPPFDIRDYPSPLNGFRKYVKEQNEAVLFTVQGLPADARIRLATMDAYDGNVWNVAGGAAADEEASGYFRRVGAKIATDHSGEPFQLTIHVDELDGVWLPDLGSATAIRFGGDRGAELADSFRYNQATDTGVVPAGLRTGDSYVLEGVLPADPGQVELADRPTPSLRQPDLTELPAVVETTAVDLVGNAQGAYDRAAALAGQLVDVGFFSDGGTGEAASRAGHGAGRIAEFLGTDPIVGNEEQYAATMALMARYLGLPARVVMGFAPEAVYGDVTPVRGEDVTAWVEIAFEGVGWVAFDPTPDESKVPQEQTLQQAPRPQPAVQQPPPQAQEPPEPVVPLADEEDGGESERRDPPEGGLATLLLVAAAVGLPGLLLLLVAALIVGLKLRRRHRRRRRGLPHQRISSGWNEVVDTAYDLGTRPPSTGTRREVAGSLGHQSAVGLATRADAAVFGPADPTEEDVTWFWSEVDGALRDMTQSVGNRRRLRGRLSLASLRRR